MRYRGYAGLPVQGARAGLPMACPTLARSPLAGERQAVVAGPAYAGSDQPLPENGPGRAIPGSLLPPAALGASEPPVASATPGTANSPDPAAGGPDKLSEGKPDGFAALPPLNDAPLTPGARRQRLILMFCGAAVTIGVGVPPAPGAQASTLAPANGEIEESLRRTGKTVRLQLSPRRGYVAETAVPLAVLQSGPRDSAYDVSYSAIVLKVRRMTFAPARR